MIIEPLSLSCSSSLPSLYFQATTTVVSMTDKRMIMENCKAVLYPLSEREEHAKEYVLNNIFSMLKFKDWEGVEVKEYWKNLEETKS